MQISKVTYRQPLNIIPEVEWSDEMVRLLNAYDSYGNARALKAVLSRFFIEVTQTIKENKK